MEISENFIKYPKMTRWGKTKFIITEKIDGTNAQIYIEDDIVMAGSRNRWLTPENDNYGFARWVAENAEALKILGPGRHYGEWWGQGIQRRYGLQEKRFSLFNTKIWYDTELPKGVYTIPILEECTFDTLSYNVYHTMERLKHEGSVAAPGFMKPEGIVIHDGCSERNIKHTFEYKEGKWSNK